MGATVLTLLALLAQKEPILTREEEAGAALRGEGGAGGRDQNARPHVRQGARHQQVLCLLALLRYLLKMLVRMCGKALDINGCSVCLRYSGTKVQIPTLLLVQTCKY
jgi:hypothetical protein